MPPNCRRSRRFLGQPLSRLRLVERICERRRRQFSDDQRGLWHCRGIASFELDLWSRKRNLTRAAFETWLASDEGNKAATIALVAEVANAWLTIGADSEALAIARETLASREATLAVSRQRKRKGSAPVSKRCRPTRSCKVPARMSPLM
jgi:hypothetical protein